MSKKWITFLVAAAIGALLLPTAALAACRVDIVNTISGTATGSTWQGDPVPYPTGALTQQLFENPAPAGNPVAGAYTTPTLDKEGVFERPADVLISDDASGVATCFAAVNNVVTLSINAVMTAPVAGGGVPAAPANLDVYDSQGISGLGITASSAIAIGGGNTQQTVITLVVSHVGTAGDLLSGAAGAAVRVKNLRFDATTIPTVQNAANWTAAFNGASITVTKAKGAALAGSTAGAVVNLLTIHDTLTANVSTTGSQNSGSGLTGGFAKTPTIQQAGAGTFRTAGGACNSATTATVSWTAAKAGDTCASGVANDVATVATSLAVALTGIPSAVTVTFPSSLNDLGGGGVVAATTPIVTFSQTARGGSPLAFTGAVGSSTDIQVFDTSVNTGVGGGIKLETADNADPGTPIGTAIGGTTNPNCTFDSSGNPISTNAFNASAQAQANCDSWSKIGVFVGNPSGQGRVSLNSAIGRGTTSFFTGDDLAGAGVFPAYTGANRSVISGQNVDPNSSTGTTYFVITPVRTTLLYPYVTTAGHFNSGIAVVSTARDANVFLNSSGTVKTSSTSTLAGAITFYFVGTSATGVAFSGQLSTDLSAGGTAIPTSVCPQAVNLDSAGRLPSGASFACGVSGLLSLISGAPSDFTGYAIAVISASRAHGFSAQFNAAGAPYAANSALVINQNSTGRMSSPCTLTVSGAAGGAVSTSGSIACEGILQ